MMFVHVLLLCCLSAADFSEISQPVRVQSVTLGGSATIQCHIEGNFDTRVWYRLTSAKTLQFVANFNTKFSHVELSEDVVGRYSVDASGSNNHLKISTTTWTDVGTYYCGVIQLDRVQFGRGTFLMLEGAKMSSVVQNPPSQSVQPGASVTLGCSVHTDLCTPEHTRVTWLKTPKKSPPEIKHWSGSDESRCTNDWCVYELLLRNLSPDDAGTFFCVAAACGQVLLGGGTELSITRDQQPINQSNLSPTLIGLFLSNMVFGILALVFFVIACKKHKKTVTENNVDSSTTNQASDGVVYASVCSVPKNPSRQATLMPTQDSVVYSDIKITSKRSQKKNLIPVPGPPQADSDAL